MTLICCRPSTVMMVAIYHDAAFVCLRSAVAMALMLIVITEARQPWLLWMWMWMHDDVVVGSSRQHFAYVSIRQHKYGGDFDWFGGKFSLCRN